MSLNAHVGIPFVQTTKHMFGTALMVVSGLVVGKCFLGLSSPRAESARAFTGRRCPHSERGGDFFAGQLNFFTETAVIP